MEFRRPLFNSFADITNFYKKVTDDFVIYTTRLYSFVIESEMLFKKILIFTAYGKCNYPF